MVKHIKKVLYIIAAVIGISVAVNMFLGPHSIAAGGITGLAIIFESLFGFSRSVTIFIGNGIILLAALVFLGKEIFLNTVIGAILLPVGIRYIPQITLVSDTMLSMLVGSALMAISASILYSNHASTGGTTLPPLILKKYFGINPSIGLLISDGIVIVLCLIVFDIDTFFYAILTVVLVAIIMGYIESGLNKRKMVYIISDHSEAITTEIQTKLDRGVTLVPIIGAYERKKREMIIATMDSRNYRDLLDIVKRHDDKAFMITDSVSQVHGQGFTYNSGSV
ncbi:MAG: YitT family protein [Oscillospiraceae bacterium]|nr:YitT family protein [Oscillospiraceae bacterium]